MIRTAYILLSIAALIAHASVSGGKGSRRGKGQKCKKQVPVKWQLCNEQKEAIEFSSNLCGNGRDKNNAEEFRIKGLTQVNGTALDLLVTVVKGEACTDGAYVSPCPLTSCRKNVEAQGTGNCWGIMPWYAHTHTKYRWRWVKAGTYEVVEVDRFEMYFYDLDRTREDYGGLGPDNEYMEFNTRVASIQHGQHVEQIKLRNGNIKMQSKEVGWDDNLAQWGKMSTVQKAREIKVSYEKRGEWYITFGHSGPTPVRKHKRVVEFTGVVYTCQ